jgi:hypothetical protein
MVILALTISLSTLLDPAEAGMATDLVSRALRIPPLQQKCDSGSNGH